MTLYTTPILFCRDIRYSCIYGGLLILFDTINVLVAITALLNLILGVVIYFNGQHKKINSLYSLIIMAVISWVLAMVMYRSSTQSMGLFWCTILYLAPTFIASSLLYFTYFFPSEKDKNIEFKKYIILTINLFIAIMVVWPGLIIKEVNVRPGLENQIIFTQYYWIYVIYIIAFFNYGFYRLFIKYLRGNGSEKQQIIYVLIGDVIATTAAFITNLILP